MEFDSHIAEAARADGFDMQHPLSARDGRRTAVRVTERFEASPERVFDAWLDPAIAGRWLFAMASRPMSDVAIDARVGGAFRFVERSGGERVEHAGVYVEIAAPQWLAFTLSTASHPQLITRVGAEIVPLKKGSRVIVTHGGLPPEHARHIETRWMGMLYGLGQVLGG